MSQPSPLLASHPELFVLPYRHLNPAQRIRIHAACQSMGRSLPPAGTAGRGRGPKAYFDTIVAPIHATGRLPSSLYARWRRWLLVTHSMSDPRVSAFLSGANQPDAAPPA